MTKSVALGSRRTGIRAVRISTSVSRSHEPHDGKGCVATKACARTRRVRLGFSSVGALPTAFRPSHDFRTHRFVGRVNYT